MPAPNIKDLAKKAGKSEAEAEKLWDKAKEVTEEEFGKKEKDFTDKEWAYTTGTLKNMLGIKESRKEKKISFFESSFSALDYMNHSLYPEEYDTYDSEEYLEDDDEDEEGDYEDSYEDEIEETMTSGGMTGGVSLPQNPIDPMQDYEEDDDEEEEEFGREPYEDMVDLNSERRY